MRMAIDIWKAIFLNLSVMCHFLAKYEEPFHKSHQLSNTQTDRYSFLRIKVAYEPFNDLYMYIKWKT